MISLDNKIFIMSYYDSTEINSILANKGVEVKWMGRDRLLIPKDTDVNTVCSVLNELEVDWDWV